MIPQGDPRRLCRTPLVFSHAKLLQAAVVHTDDFDAHVPAHDGLPAECELGPLGRKRASLGVVLESGGEDSHVDLSPGFLHDNHPHLGDGEENLLHARRQGPIVVDFYNIINIHSTSLPGVVLGEVVVVRVAERRVHPLRRRVGEHHAGNFHFPPEVDLHPRSLLALRARVFPVGHPRAVAVQGARAVASPRGARRLRRLLPDGRVRAPGVEWIQRHVASRLALRQERGAHRWWLAAHRCRRVDVVRLLRGVVAKPGGDLNPDLERGERDVEHDARSDVMILLREPRAELAHVLVVSKHPHARRERRHQDMIRI